MRLNYFDQIYCNYLYKQRNAWKNYSSLFVVIIFFCFHEFIKYTNKKIKMSLKVFTTKQFGRDCIHIALL